MSASRVFIGFDGFIDTLLHCVEKRLGPHSFKRLGSIPVFSKIISKAASQSTNIECVIQEQALGGNAPLLARALATLGIPGTVVGALGYPSVHPLFRSLAPLGIAIHSFADPGYTDALEFTDGKLLLGKMGELHKLTLKEISGRLSPHLLDTCIQEAEVLATVNWTMMPLVREFWSYLLKHPRLLKNGPRKSLFVDLADPAKRPLLDLKEGLSCLSSLNTVCDVILGLNRSECRQVQHALRLKASPSLKICAERIATALRISSVVLHSRTEVAVATLYGNRITSEEIKVPLCTTPRRTTGAGDTFNAGFLAGVIQHQPPLECLKMAVAASGIFIRTGISPTPKSMARFFRQWK